MFSSFFRVCKTIATNVVLELIIKIDITVLYIIANTYLSYRWWDFGWQKTYPIDHFSKAFYKKRVQISYKHLFCDV